MAEEIRAAIRGEEQRSINNIQELEDLAEKWRKVSQGVRDDLLDNAHHLLIHFLSDRDIRLRDARYAEAQIAELNRRAAELEEAVDKGTDS